MWQPSGRRSAARGKAIFMDQAQCAVCHAPPLFTEPGWNMHTAEEIGIDDFQAKRSPCNGRRFSSYTLPTDTATLED